MANPLIKSSGGNVPVQRMAPRNPLQYMSQFLQNPVSALRQSGYNIPDGMTDARQIVNYLINNGQLGQGKLGQLQQMAKLIGRR